VNEESLSRLEEFRDYLCASRMAIHPALTSNLFRQANPLGRHGSLPGVTLDKQLIWSPHIEQVSRTVHRMGLLGPLLNRSELSIRNGVLLYKQLIRPLMDYACSVWRSAARTTWYLSNRQIHDDLGVPLFAEHIRALAASFDSRLADVGNPLFQQLSRYLC
jgi:hypothetical protein